MKLTKPVVFNQIFTTLSNWWELGYRDLPYNYKRLINQCFPFSTFGTIHASYVKSACIAWEEKYGVEIGTLLPNLEPNASKWISTHR
jgi:hypothetical protein